MLSFHGKPELKEHYVKNAIWHREADKFVQGRQSYDENQKGCMIACSFKNYDHKKGSEESGFPEWLLRLADTIFEGLTKEESDFWTERFWSAAGAGVDLEQVKSPFLIFVLESTLETFEHDKFPNVKKCIDDVIGLFKSGETNISKFRKARDAAADATSNVYAAHSYSAGAAYYAAGAYSSSRAVAYAAYHAANATYAAAQKNCYSEFADKLIDIMKGLEA